jgi:hypothetical protein
LPEWGPAFLDALVEDPNVSRAASIARVGRQYSYEVRAKNEALAKAWDEAEAHAVDTLESEARRRCYKGTTRPVFYKGERVGHIREFSDLLMMFLLKAHRPSKYRELQTAAPSGPPVHVDLHVDVGVVLAESMRRVADQPLVPGLPVLRPLPAAKDEEDGGGPR